MHLGGSQYMTGDSVFDAISRGRAAWGNEEVPMRGRVKTGDSVASEVSVASDASFFSTGGQSISTVEIVPGRPMEQPAPLRSRQKMRRHSLGTVQELSTKLSSSIQLDNVGRGHDSPPSIRPRGDMQEGHASGRISPSRPGSSRRRRSSLGSLGFSDLQKQDLTGSIGSLAGAAAATISTAGSLPGSPGTPPTPHSPCETYKSEWSSSMDGSIVVRMRTPEWRQAPSAGSPQFAAATLRSGGSVHDIFRKRNSMGGSESDLSVGSGPGTPGYQNVYRSKPAELSPPMGRNPRPGDDDQEMTISRQSMSFNSMPKEEDLPEGWKVVPSISREGQWTYLNGVTGERIASLSWKPSKPAAETDLGGGADLPEGWELVSRTGTVVKAGQRSSRRSSSFTYRHRETGETQHVDMVLTYGLESRTETQSFRQVLGIFMRAVFRSEQDESRVQARKEVVKGVFGFIGFALMFTSFVGVPLMVGFANIPGLPWHKTDKRFGQSTVSEVLGPFCLAAGFFPALCLGYIFGNADALGWDIVRPVVPGSIALMAVFAFVELSLPALFGVSPSSGALPFDALITGIFGFIFYSYLIMGIGQAKRKLEETKQKQQRVLALEQGFSQSLALANEQQIDTEAAKRAELRRDANLVVKMAHIWPTVMIVILLTVSSVVIRTFSLLDPDSDEILALDPDERKAEQRRIVLEKMAIRLLAWPLIQSIGAGIVRQSAALMIGSARAIKIQFLTLHMYQAFMTVAGRTMLFLVGSPHMVMIATIISGVSEVFQRSTLVFFDEFIRKTVFRAPINHLTRARQIEVWTQDVCGCSMVELAVIPVLGFQTMILKEHSNVFILSSNDNEGQVTM